MPATAPPKACPGVPFAGVYANVIQGNFAEGNGLAGITVHQHFAGDLNENKIVDNVLVKDNVDGDMDFATADPNTTGILVASGLPPAPPGTFPESIAPGPIKDTVISGNSFFDVNTGIWTLNADPGTTTVTGNHFAPSVTTDVSTN